MHLPRLSLLPLLAAPLLGPSVAAAAQDPASPAEVQPRRITGPTRHAGIYHVATGTWTRGPGGESGSGAQVVYANTAHSTYFAGIGIDEGAQWVDEGHLPGTTSPFGADRDCYRLTGFEFWYATTSPSGQLDARFHWYDSYRPCDDPGDPQACIHEAGSFDMALPGSDLPGAPFQFWVVQVDLTGLEIDLQADGGPCSPVRGGDSDLDSFGWGIEMLTGTLGPVIAGDPSWNAAVSTGQVGLGLFDEIGGTGTYYDDSGWVPCDAQGDTAHTGLNTRDLFWVSEGTSPGSLATGCYFFGGYFNENGCGQTPNSPFASYWLRLFAEPLPGACEPLAGATFACDATTHCGGRQSDGASVGNTGPLPFGPVAVVPSYGGLAAGEVAHVDLVHGPAGQWCYVLMSDALTLPGVPLSNGLLCLAEPQGQYNLTTATLRGVPVLDSAGVFGDDGTFRSVAHLGAGATGFDVPEASPLGGTLLPGSTWCFQGWYRCGAQSNFSTAVRLTLP